ncbi:MAG: hypothetical protein DMG59_02200 [Acidobacteria bacterium]|nr:MAG: hypothetical protein DMG59_02200 [Acidobacteriota bacterium]
MDRMDDKLDALWSDYREACPDPEPGPDFMPKLWQRIEAQRAATTSVFRRLTAVCVAATAMLTLLMAMVLIPLVQRLPVYSASYVDELTAQHPNTYVDILNGDIR